MYKINKTFINQMFAFIKKDVTFNLLYALIAIALAVIFPIALKIDTTNPVITLYMLAPFIASNLFITKVCYTEDDYLTRTFLKTLPVTRFLRVSSRYITGFLSVLVLNIACFSVASILGFIISLQGILLCISGLLLYYALYFFLFFKFNYNVAQKTTIIFVLSITAIYFVKFNAKFLNNMSLWTIATLASLISSLVYCFSCNLCCKNDR